MSAGCQPSPTEVTALSRRGFYLGNKIGEGSYADVYLTLRQDAHNDRSKLLACKIFDISKANVDCRNLPRELMIHKQLKHPHVIDVDSIMTRGSKVFIFMQYAKNGDLLNFIKESGSVNEKLSKKWFKQMVSGLDYLHGLNIAHRDLKCENILLSRHFDVKIADFGFARFCVDESGRRILSKTFCGSCAYAAPEIVSGVAYNPKLADIWSLGVILFIMLNGSMPFDDSSLSRLLKCQVMKKWKFDKKARETTTFLARHLVKVILEPDVTRRLRLGAIQRHRWLQSDEVEETKPLRHTCELVDNFATGDMLRL